MSELNHSQTSGRYLSQAPNAISTSEPSPSGRIPSTSQELKPSRSIRRQIPRSRSNEFSGPTTRYSIQDHYQSYRPPLSIAENSTTYDFESSQVGSISSKGGIHRPMANAETDYSNSMSGLGKGSNLSDPKNDLVFQRTLHIPQRNSNRRKFVLPTTGTYPPSPSLSRIPSKPFPCPKPNCSRSFSNENELKYHTMHGYCNSLIISQLYISPSVIQPTPIHPEDRLPTLTASPSEETSSVISLPKSSGISIPAGKDSPQKDHKTAVINHHDSSSARRISDIEAGAERGRSRHRSQRAASVPNPHKSDLSFPSRLVSYPPPPPFGPNDHHSEERHRREEERRRLRAKDQYRVHNNNEWDSMERTQHTYGDLRLTRSLSSSRLSERDPVMSRPYSRASSRPPSIQTFPGTPPWSTPTSLSSSFQRPASRSFPSSHSSIEPPKLTTSSRLANPLPLPPNVRIKFLRTARQQEWGALVNKNSKKEDINATPKTPSPQISFRRFSRPPSPRPSSFPSSLQSSFSRKSSTSSLSRPSSSPSSSIRFSPNSSPKLSSLVPSFIRSSVSLGSSSHLTDSSPSPLPRSPQRTSKLSMQRDRPLSWREKVRQGFWNRRGDFLTEDGFVVYAPPDRVYPEDLSTYPRETEGYQDHELDFRLYFPRPELPESLPRHGRPPERPYDSFIVYVYK